MAIERIIGIDFGTSTTVVKVKTYEDGRPMGAREMSDYVRFDNKATVPTLVYKTNDGRYLVGYEAENAAVKGVLCQNFKLNLSDASPEIRQEAIFYSELFFKYLYDEYSNQKSYFPACDTETTYVSYPAKWSDDLRTMMTGIAVKAGFKNVKGLDEPTAAIHAVMVQEAGRLNLEGRDSLNILMIDMGAGTTDLVLCTYTPSGESRVRILETWPKADSTCLFGGREIDEALCEYIKSFLAECGLPNTSNFKQKYLDKCKAWKENNVSPILREREGVVRFCGFIDAMLSMLDVDMDFPPLSRDGLETMLSDYLSQFPGMISDCLASAGFDGSRLDYVILTGGHSQWYFAEEILSGALTRFGNPHIPRIKAEPSRIVKMAIPQETVAAGLVYQKLNASPVRAAASGAQNTMDGGGYGSEGPSPKEAVEHRPTNAYTATMVAPGIGTYPTIAAGTSGNTIRPAVPSNATPPIRSIQCRMAGIGNHLVAAVKGVKKENEASVYAVTGTLNLFGDRMEFDVDTHKHPTYSKNKHIVLSYALIKNVKKRYAAAFTAEETLASAIPYYALGKLIAKGNKSLMIEYNIDAQYIFTFDTKGEAEEMLAFISKKAAECKGR
jgi:molecular chaperone DnaK (HSP70)